MDTILHNLSSGVITFHITNMRKCKTHSNFLFHQSTILIPYTFLCIFCNVLSTGCNHLICNLDIIKTYSIYIMFTCSVSNQDLLNTKPVISCIFLWTKLRYHNYSHSFIHAVSFVTTAYFFRKIFEKSFFDESERCALALQSYSSNILALLCVKWIYFCENFNGVNNKII